MNRLLRNIGFFLLLIGAATFAYPAFFGRHLWFMVHFGEYEKIAGGVALGLGAAIFGLSFRKKKEDKK